MNRPITCTLIHPFQYHTENVYKWGSVILNVVVTSIYSCGYELDIKARVDVRTVGDMNHNYPDDKGYNIHTKVNIIDEHVHIYCMGGTLKSRIGSELQNLFPHYSYTFELQPTTIHEKLFKLPKTHKNYIVGEGLNKYIKRKNDRIILIKAILKDKVNGHFPIPGIHNLPKELIEFILLPTWKFKWFE